MNLESGGALHGKDNMPAKEVCQWDTWYSNQDKLKNVMYEQF